MTQILAAACFALVVVQTMGLHLHVDRAGNGQGLHAAHPHHHDHGEHDHDRVLDGSKLELGNLWSKTVAVPVPVAVALTVPVAEHARSWPIHTQPVVVEPSWRWRPPLRAPPPAA